MKLLSKRTETGGRRSVPPKCGYVLEAPRKPSPVARLAVVFLIFCLAACSHSHSQAKTADPPPLDLRFQLGAPFNFVACGDSRFHDPKDIETANPLARQEIVKAIARENPAFISFGGDIVYHGDDPDDWNVWDSETKVWRANKIPVLPALGNHDLHGDEQRALANYFQRFPDLENNRYYSLRAANILMLVLDSSLDETSGPQGIWLKRKLQEIPVEVEFIFVVLHHPPYTSSSDAKALGGGHSARTPEQQLAMLLEARQRDIRAGIVVFSGHVHNYERHEHGGVTYFVTGGAGAHAYPIERAPGDPFQSKEINYHYLLVKVDRGVVNVIMRRVDFRTGLPVWTQPDSVSIFPRVAASQGSTALPPPSR